MSTRNRNLGRVGLAVAALVALSVTACDPYIQANTSAPVVLGAMVADVNENLYVPPAYAADGCYVPYPEPNYDWAKTAFPGLCEPANIAKGYPTVCPVACWPPRTGPGFAPLFTGNTGGSYLATDGSTVNYTLPADGRYTILHSPPGAAPPPADGFQFGQIRVLFNKLMAGSTIQPNPNDPARCLPATGTGGPKVFKAAIGDPTIGTDVTETELWSICYSPNSAVNYWGASMVATPATQSLDPLTKYTVTATVQDQQGNSVDVYVTVLTDAATAPATPPR